MKQWVVAFFAIGTGLGAHAQTNLPAAMPPMPSAAAANLPPVPAKPPAPVPTTKPDNARYVADPGLLAACQSQLDAFNDKPCNVIFIGGTIAAGWRGAGAAVWAKYYEPRKSLNFSIAGDTTQNVLWRLSNMEIQNLHPKVAVILIGVSNSGNTSHEIADGIKSVLVNTQAAFSNVKIILVSIVPTDRDHDKMMQVNTLIKNYAQENSVFYLDLVSRMPLIMTTNPDGTQTMNYKGISADRLSPNATGYQIWADAMEPLMAKLLGGT